MSSAGSFVAASYGGLWVMLKINGQRFYSVISLVAKMTAVAETIPRDQSTKKRFSAINDGAVALQGLVQSLNDLKVELVALGTPMTEMAVDRAIRISSGDPTGEELMEGLKNID